MCSMAAVASARYSIPHGASVATSSTNFANSKTTAGRNSLFPERTLTHGVPKHRMSDSWNPNALPFQPSGFDRRDQNFGAFENQFPPPAPPLQGPPGPYGPPGAPWNANFAPPPPLPPPPHPHMFSNSQAYNDYAAHHQAQAYHQWMMHNGYGHIPPPPPPPNFPPGPDAFAGRPPLHMPPHGPPPFGQPPHGPPPFMHQQQRQMFTSRAQNFAIHSQADFPYGSRNEDMQYAFDALFKALKSRNRHANVHRASILPDTTPKSGLAANGHDEQKEYGTLHRIASHEAACYWINKCYSQKGRKPSAPADEKGRYGDKKIMLPAPQPTEEYMDQAAGESSTNEAPNHILVILDLNGTVLYRPNRNAKTMIQRPFLKPFLSYLFENFKVMVWSSAKPDNVKSLVNQALDNELRSKLVAQWARDSFGLSPTNYQQNVQVYKNLKLVWSRNQIQSYHPEYETGGRFGQHNTVLIDDSAIKASAQPYNLLEIPTFSATPEQMQGDVLREVAGYLEVLKQQCDVSKFIQKVPFVEGGQWKFDWPDNAADGGQMTSQVSAPTPSKKKNKKKQAKAAAAAAAADQTITPSSQTPLSSTIDTLASVTLTASVQNDW